MTDRNSQVATLEHSAHWLHLAEQLGIKRQSARSIIQRYQTTGKVKGNARGGQTYKTFSDEVGNFLINHAERKPSITPKKLRQLMMTVVST